MQTCAHQPPGPTSWAFSFGLMQHLRCEVWRRAMPTPIRQQVYTLRELLQLDLRDSPSLGFMYRGTSTCVQEAHLTVDQLLSVPGLADTRWRYIRETHEWIPVFVAVDDAAVIACMDIEKDRSPYNDRLQWWVIPKGFPREQFYPA